MKKSKELSVLVDVDKWIRGGYENEAVEAFRKAGEAHAKEHEQREMNRLLDIIRGPIKVPESYRKVNGLTCPIATRPMVRTKEKLKKRRRPGRSC